MSGTTTSTTSWSPRTIERADVPDRSSIGRGERHRFVSIIGQLELEQQDHLRDTDGRDEQQEPRLVEQPAHDEQLGEPTEHRAGEDRERDASAQNGPPR